MCRREGVVSLWIGGPQQPATNAAPAVCGPDIGVADQRDVLDILQTHHAKQPSILLEAPEPDPMLDLTLQLLGRQ